MNNSVLAEMLNKKNIGMPINWLDRYLLHGVTTQLKKQGFLDHINFDLSDKGIIFITTEPPNYSNSPLAILSIFKIAGNSMFFKL
jgi:hypothetical protein